MNKHTSLLFRTKLPKTRIRHFSSQGSVMVPKDKTGEVPKPACAAFTLNKNIAHHSVRPQHHLIGHHGRPLPIHLIDFGSKLGKKLFAEAMNDGTMDSYFKLVGNYHAQGDPRFCGIAVLCMVLNSLSIDPARIWKNPWRWYSEEMMECCTPLETVKKQGIDFDQFKCLASCKGANVKAYRYGDTTLESFREAIIRVSSTTSEANELIIVSYNRKHVGQTGSGHFAPVAGYHKGTDMVLLLDVARFKYPPHWVSLPLIYEAMRDIDDATGKPRGWMVLQHANELLSQTPITDSL